VAGAGASIVGGVGGRGGAGGVGGFLSGGASGTGFDSAPPRLPL
jgi:hypothetical protein